MGALYLACSIFGVEMQHEWSRRLSSYTDFYFTRERHTVNDKKKAPKMQILVFLIYIYVITTNIIEV